MYKFKKKIEVEPEMETYEKNTDEFINKLKSIMEWLSKIGKKVTGKKTGKIIETIGAISTLLMGYNYFITDDQNNNTSEINSFKDDSLDINNYDNWEDEDYFLEENIDNPNSEEQIENLLENPDLLLYIYSALSFIQLGWSVYKFYNAYNDLKEIKNNIKGENGYEKALEKIKKILMIIKKK